MYIKIETVVEWFRLHNNEKYNYYNPQNEGDMEGLIRFAEKNNTIINKDDSNNPIEVHQMKSPLSPLDIDVLLHCYTSQLPHPNIMNIEIQNSIIMFNKCGMIAPIKKYYDVGQRPIYDVVFRTTEKGIAFINTILCTKEPVCTWLVPQQL